MRLPSPRRLLRREPLERLELDAMERLLSHGRPGETLADVGAYRGAFAREARRRGLEVVCFEPDPTNAARLKRFRVVEAVVSDRSEPVTFAARGSQVSGAADFYLSDATRFIVRPAVTLDAVFFNYTGQLRLLKVDVEGYEAKVFRGAAQVLASIRAVLVEIHPAGMRLVGDEPEEIREMLSGFDIEELDSDADTGRAHWLAVRKP